MTHHSTTKSSELKKATSATRWPPCAAKAVTTSRANSRARVSRSGMVSLDIMLRLTFANAGTVTVIAMVTNPRSGGSSYFLN